MFAEGRSNLRAVIEDDFLRMQVMIESIIKHLNNESNQYEKEKIESAKSSADEDKEIERDILNSFPDNPFDEIIPIFLNASFQAVYSFYEKSLEYILREGNIDKVPIKHCKNKKYSTIYVSIASIRNYLRDSTFKFNGEVEESIRNIDCLYRVLRNKITHYDKNKLDGPIYSGLINESLNDFLNTVKQVLFAVMDQLENKMFTKHVGKGI